jgi:hypothetical protein
VLASALVVLALVAGADPSQGAGPSQGGASVEARGAVARITLAERTPAVVIVAVPHGAAPRVPAAELVRAASLAFRAKTGLDVRGAEQAGLDPELASRCDRGRRLSCWLASLPVADRAGAKEPAIAAMLVVTVVPLEARDRVTMTLVDVARASDCRASITDGDEALEDCIWERSAKTEPTQLDDPRPEALARFFGDRIDVELAPMLDELRELAPYGRIELVSPTPGVELDVDGAPAGTLGAGTTILEDVRPGRRTLTLSRDGAITLVLPVHVARGRTSTAAVALVPLVAEPSTRPARVVFWTGAASTAAGVALGVWALARSASVTTTCLVAAPGAACESVGAPTFSGATDTRPSFDREGINPAGLSIPVVASGLTAAGAAWMTASLFEADDGVPWLPIVLGLGAGLAGASVAALLDPR